jgi:hypothetical protein
LLGQPTPPLTFLQLPLRHQLRDYLGVMLDQAAVEVDPPGLLVRPDPQFVAKSANFPLVEMRLYFARTPTETYQA